MIRRGEGGELSYTKADGTVVAAGIFDGEAYDKMLITESLQNEAKIENNNALINYKVSLANAQVSVDARGIIAPPEKPLMKLVQDDGTISRIPFDPPLADLVIPKPPTSGTGGWPPQPAVDKLELVYRMQLAIYNKMFPKT